MKLFKKEKPIIGLAPMAGYTDSAFRQVCKKFGADLVYTEMVAAQGIVYDWKKYQKDGTQKLKNLAVAKFDKTEQPIIIQIFGKDPQIMAEAAKILVDLFDPDGIDINMGCPARKVVSSFHGASLMCDPELAAEIVKATKRAIGDKILSVKTRLGWEDKNEILKFAPIIEKAGADFITIHGRTKMQGFLGEPDWAQIGKVKKLLKIPVIANGGVKDHISAEKCLKTTGADGILIGLASLGRPWIFKEIKKNKKIDLSFDEISKIAKKHIQLNQKQNKTFISLRTDLLNYFKGYKNCSKLRSSICHLENINQYNKLISEFKCDLGDDENMTRQAQ
jgi:tRNA-dihydrouridine synthase B